MRDKLKIDVRPQPDSTLRQLDVTSADSSGAPNDTRTLRDKQKNFLSTIPRESASVPQFPRWPINQLLFSRD